MTDLSPAATMPEPKARLTSLSIIIPIDLHALTPNQSSLRWQVNYGRAQKAKQTAWLCWRAAGSPRIVGRVVVDIEYRHFRARRYDSDAIVRAIKHIRDALFVRAITKSDADAWTHFRTPTQVRDPKYRNAPELVFTVAAVGGGPSSRLKPSVLVTATEEG